jgi:nicotinamidase-related amidase
MKLKQQDHDVDTLRDEPFGSAVHLCVDMQRLFAPDTDWGLAWMPRVLPAIEAICAAHAERTIFTRFIPARRPGEGRGTWARYYRRWASMTLEEIGADRVELMPELARFVPPAECLDKRVYSPWFGAPLAERLRARGCDTLILTGGETDMCVLGALLGAVDHGYRTVLVRDAICSASDESHDALLGLFSNRFGEQVEVARTETILDHWRA